MLALNRLGEGDGVALVERLAGNVGLTSATGFFLVRDQRLFLVSSRHVFIDAEGHHFPDRITIELHVNRDDMAEAATVSIPLYRNQMRLWRQAVDSAIARGTESCARAVVAAAMSRDTTMARISGLASGVGR